MERKIILIKLEFLNLLKMNALLFQVIRNPEGLTIIHGKMSLMKMSGI